MNERTWKDYLKSPPAKKEKETLGESVLAAVEEAKQELKEGQQGTAFEDVLVAVAKGEDPGAEGQNKNKAGGKKWTKYTLGELAWATLREMGYSDQQIQAGVDKNAKSVSKKGISGDPKADVVIDRKNISLKLPGTIQLGSGEGASTKDAFDLIMDEYVAWFTGTNDVKEMIENKTKTTIGRYVKEFLDALAETTGKRYYPTQSSSVTQGEWKKKVAGAGYTGLLRARAEWDWQKGKYPSAGIPASWKKDSKGNKTEDPQEAYVDGHPRFSTEDDYVEAFIERAVATADQQLDKRSWEDIKKNLDETVNSAVKNMVANDPLFYELVIDEYLTGRRQFSNPDHVATWLLSPEGFYPIETLEQTSKLAKDWKKYIKWNVRAKGREYLGKAVTFRIDLNQNAYYKALAQGLEEKAKKDSQGVSEQEETNDAETSLEDKITADILTSIVQNIKIS